MACEAMFATLGGTHNVTIPERLKPTPCPETSQANIQLGGAMVALVEDPFFILRVVG
jgi:hypothetical protein